MFSIFRGLSSGRVRGFSPRLSLGTVEAADAVGAASHAGAVWPRWAEFVDDPFLSVFWVGTGAGVDLSL